MSAPAVDILYITFNRIRYTRNNLAFSDHAATSKISFAEKGMPLEREQALAWYVKDARRVESGASLVMMGLPLTAR